MHFLYFTLREGNFILHRSKRSFPQHSRSRRGFWTVPEEQVDWFDPDAKPALSKCLPLSFKYFYCGCLVDTNVSHQRALSLPPHYRNICWCHSPNFHSHTTREQPTRGQWHRWGASLQQSSARPLLALAATAGAV